MREKRRRIKEKIKKIKKNASVSQCLNALMHLSGSQTKFLRCQSPCESFVVSRESHNIWKSVVARRKQKKGYPSCRVIHAFCPPNQFPPCQLPSISFNPYCESPARRQTSNISYLNTVGLPVPKQCCKKVCIGQRHAVLNFSHKRFYEIVHHLPAVI